MTLRSIGLLAATLLSASAQAATIYSEDFESGTASGFTTSDLWHVTSNFAANGTYALGFTENETPNSTSDNGDYNGFHDALAFSAAFLATNTSILTLNAFNHNEYGDGPDTYDRLRIGVSVDGSSITTLLGSSSSEDGVPTFAYWTPSNTGYQSLTYDLSAFAGQSIKLAFGYATIDSTDNGYSGARIDDILVSDASSVPEPAMLGLFGLGAVGLGFSRRRRVA